jgi:6-phosphofructokinase 1
MRVGVLTGGGDCPGLNAVIRAIVRKGVPEYGYSFIGFRDGWRGPLEAATMPLDIPAVRGLLPRGGTILGSSRTNPFAIEDGVQRIKHNLQNLGVDALIAIGGEDTLGVATQLHEAGVNVVGVPKTIDNDLSGTDYTFGFDTAVNIATEAIDRLHTTAESHHRVLIVEVMGRHAGWIALHAGMAGRSQHHPDPRDPVRHRPGVPLRRGPLPAALRADHRRVRGRQAKRRARVLPARARTRSATSASAASACTSPRRSRARTGQEARATVLGHVQRGGTPTARAPLAGHSVRPTRDRRRGDRALGHDARRCAARTSSRCAAGGGDQGSQVVDPALYAEAEVSSVVGPRRRSANVAADQPRYCYPSA